MEENYLYNYFEETEDQSFAIKAEKFVLGAALIDRECLLEVMNRLQPKHFHDPRHNAIMGAISELYNRDLTVDFSTVCAELTREARLELAGGTEYVIGVADSVPSIAENTSYIDLVEENYLMRELNRVCSEINGKIAKGSLSFRELSEEAVKKVTEIANSRKSGGVEPVHKFTDDVIQLAEGSQLNEKHLLGIDTGFSKLNGFTKGFKKGEMIVLAARPGVGKSAFGMNIATNACVNMGAHVAFFSLEMSNSQLTGRILASFSGVSYGKIQDGNLTAEEMRLLQAAKMQVDKLHLFLDVECDTNLSEIRAKCLKLARNGSLDLVVIDYLQLVTDQRGGKGGGNRQEEVARISRGLKKLARELEVPVLALSQLSRDVDKGEGRSEPTIADIRESGAIEQDADIVLLLFRPGNKDGEQTNGPTNHKVILNVAKNRQGKQGKINLYFKGSQFKFSEVDDASGDVED